MKYGRMNSAQQLGAGWGTPNYAASPPTGGFQAPAGYDLMSGYMPATSVDGVAGSGFQGGAAPATSLATTGFGGPTQAPGGWNWLDSVDANGAKTQGMLMPGLGVAQGFLNAYLGMKQYGLAKDQLAEGKKQFALNYDAQRTTTNSQLEDRQRARVASNAGAYQSVGSYMAANGIKAGG